MPAFTPSQIDDLKPLARRYDLAIEDDFVVTVLPNGIKTWVYLYAQDGQMQRRTLGVHPDMSFEAARLSVAAARETRRSVQDATERSVRAAAARAADAGRAPAAPAQAKRSVRMASSLAAGLIIAAGAGFGFRVAGERTHSPAVAEVPAAARESPPAQAPVPTAAPAAVATPSVGEAVAADAPSAPRDPVQADASSAATSPVRASLRSGDVGAQGVSEPIPAEAASTTTTERPPTAAREDPPGVVIHDARVVRAVLTDEVVKREPVDSVGPEVRGDPGGVSQLYFFTELRRLGGQHLRYRWAHEGRVEAEIPMAVGPGWRWRNYSRKDILPTQTGPWHVQLLDDADRVLAEARFAYRNGAPGTQSADAN